MPKIFSGVKLPRIPLPVEGIQVNFCKQPACENYGRSADIRNQSRGPRARKETRDTYKKVAAGRGFPCLECQLCNVITPIKSNQGIFEELNRISDYLNPPPEPSCPNSGCSNHIVPVSTGNGAYSSYGKTKTGSPRFRCNHCYKTFSTKSTSTNRHKAPHKNRIVFALLVNKMPFKRILKTADISAPTLYGKIDFFYRQCLAFVRDREKRLWEGFPIERAYVSIDRQDYLVNWASRVERKNIQFTAIAAACNITRYVFGHHLNYDGRADYHEIEAIADEIDDYSLKLPFRRFAHVWLDDEFQRLKHTATSGVNPETILAAVDKRYRELGSREDIELPEQNPEHRKLPDTGVMTRFEYTTYAHFCLLEKMLQGAEKVRFFFDQDSTLRAACLSIFKDRIIDRTCDAFYVHYLKHLTVDEREERMREKKRAFKEIRQRYPELSEYQVKLLMMRFEIQKRRSVGPFEDKWFMHPLPTMGEPEKAISYQTDMQDLDEDHLASLCLNATLQAVDSYFNQVRRRLSPLERGLSTASNEGRLWKGHLPYKPETLQKLIEIFRVYHNYVEPGKDKQTPAMRLGLAKGNLKIEDIIYYQ